MGLLFVGLFASAAISEGLARVLFDSKESPQPPQNPAEGHVDGIAGIVEDTEDTK
jgi:hypothetical protein